MSDPGSSGPRHLFTVDVEEYFQVTVFEHLVAPEEWDELPSRVARGVGELLELLGRYDTYATFFTLGWVADRHPRVVRAIADAGHEIASHGWWHRRIPTLTREHLRSELRDSKAILEDVCGKPIRGFRAPSFSLVPGSEWVFDLLLEEGYRYDSSVFPIRRRGYGYPGADPTPHSVERPGGTLLELPLATGRMAGVRLPAAGGGYLRTL
ncbi:MAG: polysaccharide deacetylase family protein, partial [Gemmatimonadota bacterium]